MVAHPNKLVHIHEHTHTHPQNPSESLLFNFPCVYYFIYFFKVLGNFTHLLSPFSILKIFFDFMCPSVWPACVSICQVTAVPLAARGGH